MQTNGSAMRIVLFDIDGTLLSTNGAGRRAMEKALRAHFATCGPPDYRYDGKTDRQIARDLMRASGFADVVIDTLMPAVLADYVEGLLRELQEAPHRVAAYDGVHALLDELETRADVVLGLLTGNIEAGARAKLHAASLAPSRFRVGAYGSDHEERAALPEIALRRATATVHQGLSGDSIVIVGDTPHDISCGRGIRARSVAVATGNYTVAELSEHSPAAVIPDFRDTARAIEALLGG
jgi:phosphoglycolate phosphatase